MYRCAKCGVLKARSLFSKNSGKSSGYHSYCKACNKGRQANMAKKHIAYRKAYKDRHPERYRADRILWCLRKREAAGGTCGLTRDSIIADMRANLRCPYCNDPIGLINISYDHINGCGTQVHPVCIECNLVKNILHHDDFLALIGAIGVERLMFYKDKVKRAGRPFGSTFIAAQQ